MPLVTVAGAIVHGCGSAAAGGSGSDVSRYAAAHRLAHKPAARVAARAPAPVPAPVAARGAGLASRRRGAVGFTVAAVLRLTVHLPV